MSMEFLNPHPPSHSLIRSPSLFMHDQLEHLPSRFPTSSDRIGRPAPSIHRPPFDHSARYDPLGRLSLDMHSLARNALCSSFTPSFFPSNIARGVLSDGTWTTEHPCIHAFLQSPYSRPSLKSRTSAAIYSLAALHVFYSPSHPSYDIFWHPDIKENTAIFVHEVVTMKPSSISTTPMTWLGVHDMLWQLTGIQKEYARSRGGKVAASPPAPTRRSLRKRKPVQTPLQALDAREPSEVPEPPRKRTKKSQPDESEKMAEATPLVAEQTVVSTEIEAGPSALSHTKSTTLPSPLDARGTVDTTPSPLTITSSLPSDSQPLAKDDVAQAGPSRGQTKDNSSNKASATRSSRRTRERSPSFSSGSSTAVSAAGSKSKRARSSSSVSSTSTTVDAETGGKSKGKEKAIDVAKATEEETEDEAEKRSAKSNRPATKDAASKPSRKLAGRTNKRSHEDTDKLEAAEAPRRVRKRSRVTSSRARKARKT